jgi:hypothetical protein
MKRIALSPVLGSIGPCQWRSTGPPADRWEEIRLRMSPVPNASQFINLCDEYEREALEFSDWDKWMLIEYIQGRLLPESGFRAMGTVVE